MLPQYYAVGYSTGGDGSAGDRIDRAAVLGHLELTVSSLTCKLSDPVRVCLALRTEARVSA